MSHALHPAPHSEAFSGKVAGPLRSVGLGCLVVAALIAIVSGNATEFWSAWLHNWLFSITVGLGALLFVAIQHLTKAGWSVVVRRVAECLSVTIGPIAWLAVPILVALLADSHSLFMWNDAAHVMEDPILSGKAAWLNAPFFVIRTCDLPRHLVVVCAAVLRGFCSRRPQRRRRPAFPPACQKRTTAHRSWCDHHTRIIRLDHVTRSALVQLHSGYPICSPSAMVAGLAALTLVVLGLRKIGLLPQVTVEHLHDLGKLLYGFNCFWAYIAFSQYLLIWYANIPEETGWFYHRQIHGWAEVSLVLVALHFVLPFFGLMSRGAKRHAPTLAFWSVIILVANWIDLYWLIMPSVAGPERPRRDW